MKKKKEGEREKRGGGEVGEKPSSGMKAQYTPPYLDEL